MFNDERINSISRRTIRNGIIISTLVSLVFLVIKSFPFRFVNIISELFIVITGIVIILIGKIKFSSLEKDERYYELKYSFYNKSAKFYLIFTMIGFALAIPFQYAILQDYLPVNMLLLSLEIIGLVFFYFQFKKNSIYFNYTFIENNKKTYYLTVLKKILHLVGAIGCIYLVSFLVGFLFFSGSSIINFLIIMVLSFLFSTLSLALDYLVISVLE